MDKSQMNDQQIEHLIQSSLFNDAAQISPENGTFFAIQDRLGEQKGPGMRQHVSNPLENLSEAIWRIIPVSKQRMAQALVLVAIAVVVGSYVAFAGSDDAVDSGSAAEATATTEPAIPEATPIAKLTVPDELTLFEELSAFAMWDTWFEDSMRVREGSRASGGYLPHSASDELVASTLQTQLRNIAFGRLRMLLLIYAPGFDPLVDGSPFIIDLDSFPGGNTPGSWALTADDPNVIVVEEFAFCDDGRGVYLQHSEKPIEVGETFAWDIYTTVDDPLGDFHLVLTAEPDSPITHDGPDPKRLDLKLTTELDVVTADLGVKLVGMFGRDPAVVEMCKN
ncbi:hypothetical protein GKO46_01915 [SAR202 cluster bacterium JH702]|uniref:DUF1214 domain-containing protein n=1 Tax=Candidatus Lucifugimonas marina TaxID=3038979 RepID=A0ABD4XMK9_9CHLR|nr:hypothetical protein [SAR202 cluster bacterium JH702]